MTQKSAILADSDAGLGIRCSILLSYGRIRSFPRESGNQAQPGVPANRNRTEPPGTFGHRISHILGHSARPVLLLMIANEIRGALVVAGLLWGWM